MAITWLGEGLGYHYLRSLVKYPFALNDSEISDIQQFIREHGFKKSDFDWFLEMSGPSLHLGRKEEQALIDFVDRMEKGGTTTDNMVRHCQRCYRYEWRCQCEE